MCVSKAKCTKIEKDFIIRREILLLDTYIILYIINLMFKCNYLF